MPTSHIAKTILRKKKLEVKMHPDFILCFSFNFTMFIQQSSSRQCGILLFKKLINLFILFYSIVLVLPYTDLNPPCMYMGSPPWTPLPPPSPSSPSGSSQCTSLEHPVSCIEPERMALTHIKYHMWNESPWF